MCAVYGEKIVLYRSSVSRALSDLAEAADGFDSARVPASPALRDFLAADHPSNPHDAALELRELAQTYLYDGAGALVLCGLDCAEEAGRRAVVQVTRLLGEPLPQNKEGTLIREVRDRGASLAERGRVRYSDTRFGGDLHTDGAEAPLPAPEVFTLFCVRQSETGGSLRYVHVRDLTAALPDSALDVLRRPFHFDRRGDQAEGADPTVRKPVLFVQNNRPAITYLRRYIEQGHDHPGVPDLTAEQTAALDALDEAILACSATAVTGKLREGELALFDNLSVLHGRTEFTDTPDHRRLLLRTWVRSTEKAL